MGRDKARLVLGGVSLLERTAGAAREVAPDVLVVGRPRPPDWPLEGVRFVEDEVPGVGPIGGLLTALRQHAAPVPGGSVLAVACDMPRLTSGALRWLQDAASGRHLRDGLVVENGGQVEPLFAIYTAACLPLVERQIAAGRRSLQALIAAGRFEHLGAPPEIAPALRNVNTPEEFAHVDHLLQRVL